MLNNYNHKYNINKINLMLSNFKNKRIFITGSTGFKGTWLSYILTLSGAKVMGYALPHIKDEKSHYENLNLKNRITQIEDDITNREKIISTMQKFEPDYVFHLAAQALVRPSYEDPYNTFKTNVMGSVNILDAVLTSKSIRSFIYVTSDKCYENNEWIWGYRENDRLGGKDPYSASKAAAENVFLAYNESFFKKNKELGVASVRAGNVIGGGDWAIDRIVPDCIRCIDQESPIILRNPLATRPWQHVLEPLSGYLKLALYLYENPKKFSGSWNFGPSTFTTATVGKLAKSIINYFGKGKIIEKFDPNQPHEAGLLQLNCDKAHQELNWKSNWNLEKTFKVTADWYKRVLSGENVENVTKEQINDYFKEFK